MKKMKFLIVFIIFFVLLFFCVRFVYSVEKVPKNEFVEKSMVLKINQYPLDINEILYNNTKEVLEEELILEEMDLEYNTIYNENPDLPTGTIHIVQMGINGKQDIITIKKYKNDELYVEEIVSNNIKRASINKIVEIGTGIGKNNYKIKEQDNLYVTPASLKIMNIPSNNGEKIGTLLQGNKVFIQEIYDENWCYIIGEQGQGYILAEGLSNINPLRNEYGGYEYNVDEFTRAELLEKLNFDMDVSQPSGLSLEQFRKILRYNEKDKNNIFTENADYFYYAEQEYGINGVFLAAIAIHESGYGTSKIAIDKNNLFGYMAYDNSPYASAKTFNTYSEGIDLVARLLMKYYLTPNGSTVYGGEIADGRYYSGKTIKSVNKFYATDSNWANGIFAHMKALYEAL